MTGLPTPIRFQPETTPILLTAIHTEEEFDWSKPFDTRSNQTTHVRELGRAQEIFTRLNVPPTYFVDYPIASQDTPVKALHAVLNDQAAELGAHLHPWVNPPLGEVISSYHSYPGNLPRDVEHAKLLALTGQIEQSFGHRPIAYLAGRYGFGRHSLSVLQELGYRVDLSAVAMGDFRGDGGPDFRRLDNNCFWEGTPRVLRIPHSTADVGLLCQHGRRRVDPGQGAVARRLHLAGILARTGAVRRVRLTPEGFAIRDLMEGAQALIAGGVRVLVFSFHSPSLVPGFTPYVRDRHDRDRFLRCIDAFLRFFREEFGGRFGVPQSVLIEAEAASRAAANAAVFDRRPDPEPSGTVVNRPPGDQATELPGL